MVLRKETEDFVSIGNDDFNIVIHSPPLKIPKDNFNTVKMFLTASSHEDSRKKAVELGGDTLDGEWANPIFKICNISDPEGNHIQLREFV